MKNQYIYDLKHEQIENIEKITRSEINENLFILCYVRSMHVNTIGNRRDVLVR